MKKIILILSFLFFAQLSFSQKSLSKQTIKDFAAVCWYNYRFGNESFIASMNTYLPYTRPQVAFLMENLETDSKGREDVFKLFYRIAGNYESLFNNFYALKLTASESKEIATYIVSKYGDESEGKVTNTEISKPFYIKDGKEVYINESEVKYDKLFTGIKTFADSDNSWKYVVMIKNDSVTIKLYSGSENDVHPDHNKVMKSYKGVVRGNKFYSRGKDLGFKMFGGVLYEQNNEGTWNEYNEVVDNETSRIH